VASAGCYHHPFEICNGLDDDDDEQTVDGAEDPMLGGECDGPDADQCREGSLVCIDGAIACNDATSDNVEECNGQDDDCDGIVDEMFDVETDPTHCGACNVVCTNANGGVACTAGVCDPVCASGAEDCNGDPADGCEVFRDRDPTCDDITASDAFPGDEGASTTSFEGTDEALFEITLQEVSTSGASIRGRIELDLPPGLDFDLIVYCDACGGAIAGSSRHASGVTERVDIAAPDIANVNSDYTVYVEVKYVSQTTCGDPWRLTVTGNTGAATGSVCR
jgi:hypothetical protein